MEPLALLEKVEALVRTNQDLLVWMAVIGWGLIGLMILGLLLRGQTRNRWVWITSAVLSLLFSGEMAVPHRFDLANLLRAALRAIGGEEAIRGRRPLQAAVIVILAIVTISILTWFLRRGRRISATARWVGLGTAISLFGYALETISLHQIDHYYLIYWSIWYSGILFGFIGVIGEYAGHDVLDSRREPSLHARYSVTSLGLRKEGDLAIHRLLRLAFLLILLVSPELVDLATRLLASK